MKQVICLFDHSNGSKKGDIFDVLDESTYFWYIAPTEGGKPFWASKDSYKLYYHPSFEVNPPYTLS